MFDLYVKAFEWVFLTSWVNFISAYGVGVFFAFIGLMVYSNTRKELERNLNIVWLSWLALVIFTLRILSTAIKHITKNYVKRVFK